MTRGNDVAGSRTRLRRRPRTGRRGLVRVAALGTVFAIVTAVTGCDDENYRAANEQRVARMCKGLLPAGHLRSVLPRESHVTDRQYGTILQPDRDSHALLDCSVTWEDENGPGQNPGVRVRAMAALGRVPQFSDELDDFTEPRPPDSGFGLPLPADADGAVTLEGLDRVTASLTVSCPKGLSGRVRPSKDLHVSVQFPQQDPDAYALAPPDRRAAARTAVKVADLITEEQHCGTPRLADSKKRKPAPLCSWLDPKALGLTDNTWKPDSDEPYQLHRGSCGAGTDTSETRRENRPGLTHVATESWAGIHARSAYEDYKDHSEVPGVRGRATFPEPARVRVRQRDDDAPEHVLWARSECDGGRTYHRVAVGLGITDSRTSLTGKEVKQLSQDARRILGAYLDAPAGWPQRSHCHDTELLGEVSDWFEGERS